MNEISTLQSLPDHPLLHILSYLKYSDLVAFAQVCRRLYRLAGYEPLWRRQCQVYWDVQNCEQTSWKDCFIEWYKDFGRYINVYRPIRKAWDQIQSFTEKNCPAIWNSIAGGLSESMLAAIEQQLHASLPNDYRCSCRLFNGRNFYPGVAPPGLLGTIEFGGYKLTQFLRFPAPQSLDDDRCCISLSSWVLADNNEEVGQEVMSLTDQGGSIPGQIYYQYCADEHMNDHMNKHGEFITGDSFLTWFTSFAQQLADNVFPVVDGHIYRFYHEPGTVAETNGIRVSVATAFVQPASSIAPPHFSHAYRITMSMDPAAPTQDSCQLSTRSWTITDEDGREEKVEGPGVVGEYPVMRPGSSHTWISSTHFQTTYGNMRGYFTMINLDTGASVDVQCPTFHMKCLPYQTTAERRDRALSTKKRN